jgi:hypothetical protein
MADYFDSIRGTTPALLSEEERKRLGLLSQVMNAIPARPSPESAAEQGMLQEAGFISRAGAPGADGQPGPATFITPERLIAEQQAAVMNDQIADIQKRYDEQRTSAMFRLGDGLADAGRLFLSPLLFLAGEDFNDYDPSAKLRAGYRRELQGLVQTQNESLTSLINARTDREKTLREIREDRAKLGPFGGMGDGVESWARRTVYGAARNPASPEYAAAYNTLFGATTNTDPVTGKPYTIQRQVDPNVPLPTGYKMPEGLSGGASEQRTDASNKAEVYSGQMFEPAIVLQQMEAGGYRLSPAALKAVELLGPAAMSAPGISEDDKAYLAAMDSYINGRLRFESGAAISEEEYKRALKQTAALQGVDGGALAIRQRQRASTLETVIRSTAPSYRDNPDVMARLEALRALLPPQYQYSPAAAPPPPPPPGDDDMVEIPDELLLPGGD